MNSLRKAFTASLAAATLFGAVAASTPAAAWHYGRWGGWGGYGGWGGGWGGWGYGAPVAAGLLGGLTLGTLAGAAAASPYYGYGYGGYPYGYAGYPYGYAGYSPYYGRRCTCW